MTNSLGYVGIHKKDEFSFFDLLEAVKSKKNFHKVGAIATFVGVVRGETLDGKDVEESSW